MLLVPEFGLELLLRLGLDVERVEALRSLERSGVELALAPVAPLEYWPAEDASCRAELPKVEPVELPEFTAPEAEPE